MVEFCRDRGLVAVPLLWRGKYADFNVLDWVDNEALGSPELHKYHEEGYPQAVPLDKESPCDEGVCIRLDGMAPYILKAKGEAFYEHESKMLDEEAVDTEAEGSENG